MTGPCGAPGCGAVDVCARPDCPGSVPFALMELVEPGRWRMRENVVDAVARALYDQDPEPCGPLRPPLKWWSWDCAAPEYRERARARARSLLGALVWKPGKAPGMPVSGPEKPPRTTTP